MSSSLEKSEYKFSSFFFFLAQLLEVTKILCATCSKQLYAQIESEVTKLTVEEF